MDYNKDCLKCGFAYTGNQPPPAACPECGAYYAKVEAHLQNGSPLKAEKITRKKPYHQRLKTLLNACISKARLLSEAATASREKQEEKAALARQSKGIVVRLYTGTYEETAGLLQSDANKLAQEGFEPIHQQWQPKTRGGGLYFGNCLLPFCCLLSFGQ